jgi:hypothetical protein
MPGIRGFTVELDDDRIHFTGNWSFGDSSGGIVNAVSIGPAIAVFRFEGQSAAPKTDKQVMGVNEIMSN